MKSDEEVADDGDDNGNRKLVIIKARHGSGLEYGNYINVKMNGAIAKLTEWYTRDEIKNGAANASQDNSFEIRESESGEDLFDM
jgi:hypothetical protein